MKLISKKRIQLRQNAIMRGIRRRHRIVRSRNMRNNSISVSYIRNNYKTSKNKNYQQRRYFVTAKLPDQFEILNIEKSLEFINETFVTAQKQNALSIQFDLSNVTRIDMVAICWLLSLINKLSTNGVNCYGNFPNDLDTMEFVKESGFLNVMKSNLARASQKNFQNQMYMIGKGHIDPTKLARSVKESFSYLIGEEEHYPPVYDNLIEICANSVEHANITPYDKNWLVSISYNQDKVCFILTDTGKGILSTLKRKKAELFADIVHFKQDTEMLRGVFEGAYQSQTGEINRHKGLPEVYESFTEGWISDLQVITNCVLYNFETKQKRILTNEFKGVMISWTLSKQNIEKWKRSLLEY